MRDVKFSAVEIGDIRLYMIGAMIRATPTSLFETGSVLEEGVSGVMDRRQLRRSSTSRAERRRESIAAGCGKETQRMATSSPTESLRCH